MTGSPSLLVVVAGTGTDVGKTWVTCGLCVALRESGLSVAARKPAQSFAAGTPQEQTDAGLLAAATERKATDVCPAHRWYPRPMAPPMAAASMGLTVPTLNDLMAEISWPPVDVGLVELAGGVASPLAADGDGADLVKRLRPALVVLVAPSGLGVLNDARLSARALGAHQEIVVFMNRYQANEELHQRNRRWLEVNGALPCRVSLPELARDIEMLRSSRSADRD